VAVRRALDADALTSLAPAATAVERAAQAIRDSIFEGHVAPGTPLPEATLSARLRVSRTTVREALRLLMGENLLTYEPHKGAAVRMLRPDDVADIYASRRLLELSAIRRLRSARLAPGAFAAVLAECDAAAAAGDARAFGTGDLRFHAEIVALHRSVRLDAFFRQLMTELRLGFLAVDDPVELHATFLPLNHGLAGLLREGDVRTAQTFLSDYLDRAAGLVTAAVAAKAPQ
jgi:DNA-binding GntR family transcriptional regulator